MRKIAGLSWLWASFFACLTIAVLRPAGAQAPVAPIHLDDDQPVTLRFYGAPDADLFTRELDASFKGVLDENFLFHRKGWLSGRIHQCFSSRHALGWNYVDARRGNLPAGTGDARILPACRPDRGVPDAPGGEKPGWLLHVSAILQRLNPQHGHRVRRHGRNRYRHGDIVGAAAERGLDPPGHPEISLCGFVAGELLRPRLLQRRSRSSPAPGS